MKKGLVTAFVIASVLAFNACKKEEGPQGPKGDKGDKGDAGAPGAQGPIGPDGAAGKDGATIRSGAGAPAASLGNNGDYYFDKTDRLLYGPKTEADGWGAAADAVTLYGPKGDAGADGADGKDGSSFTAGQGAPTAATGKEGDFYFDTNTSTMYGPKGETDWSTGSVIPLASNAASKTYYYNAGFKVTDELVRETGEKVVAQYSDYALFSSYKINSEDLYRIARYSNWHLNREMMFESTAGSGVFDYVPQSADDFADPANQAVSVITGSATNTTGGALITIGQEFKYTGSAENEANHTFSITAEDINRLAVNNGQAFRYLVYAATKKEDITLGENLTFFQKKSLTKVANPAHFYAEYEAETSIDLNALVPDLERLKKEGAYVFAGFGLIDQDGAVIDDVNWHGPWGRGYYDITWDVLEYYLGGVAYGPNGMYTTTANSVTTGHTATTAGSANLGGGNSPYYVTYDDLGGTYSWYQPSGAYLGTVNLNLGTNQVAIPSNVAANAHYNNGKLYIQWEIESGIRNVASNYDVSPLTMTNPAPAASHEGWWENGEWVVRDFESEYYSAAAGRLVYTPAANLLSGAPGLTIVFNEIKDQYEWVPAAPVKSYVTGVNVSRGGLEASEIEKIGLVRVVVNVVDAEAVAKAKAAGIDVNNPEALMNFAKSLQLQ